MMAFSRASPRCISYSVCRWALERISLVDDLGVRFDRKLKFHIKRYDLRRLKIFTFQKPSIPHLFVESYLSVLIYHIYLTHKYKFKYENKIINFPCEIHTSSARLPLNTFKHRTSKKGYLFWNAPRSLLEGPQSGLRGPTLQFRIKTNFYILLSTVGKCQQL